MIKEQYISFETAKLAKEKGFDGQSRFAFGNDGSEGLPFDKDILMPTQSVLARWLREKHNLFIETTVDFYKLMTENEYTKYYPVYYYKIINLEDSVWTSDKHEHHSYEEAMEDGLQDALELVKSW